MNKLNHRSISQAHSLKRVIELINQSEDEADEMAAQYAIEAAVDAEVLTNMPRLSQWRHRRVDQSEAHSKITDVEIEAHLEILQKGTFIETEYEMIPVKPRFDFDAALKIAVENMGKPQ